MTLATLTVRFGEVVREQKAGRDNGQARDHDVAHGMVT